MAQLGIDVVDIRIGRADFVAENLPFAFNEMSADLLDTYKSELSNGSAEGERLARNGQPGSHVHACR